MSEIDAGAFWHNNISSVYLSNSVKTIGENAFCDCKELKTIKLPDDLAVLSGSCFSGCSSLVSIDISNNLKAIEPWAFSGCTALKKLSLPEGVETIGQGAFSSCSNLQNVYIPTTITKIENDAFASDGSLVNAFYNGDIQQWNSIDIGIGNEALTSAAIHYNMTILKLPSSLKEIEKEAFANLKSAIIVYIPITVTKIDDHAFDDSDLIIMAPSGSFAEIWANSHGFTVINP